MEIQIWGLSRYSVQCVQCGFSQVHFWKFHSSYIFSAPPDPIKSFYQQKNSKKVSLPLPLDITFLKFWKKYKCQEFLHLAHSCLVAPSCLFPLYRWSKSITGTTPSSCRWTPACRMTPSSPRTSSTSEAGGWRPSSHCSWPPLTGGRPQQLVKELESSSTELGKTF